MEYKRERCIRCIWAGSSRCCSIFSRQLQQVWTNPGETIERGGCVSRTSSEHSVR